MIVCIVESHPFSSNFVPQIKNKCAVGWAGNIKAFLFYVASEILLTKCDDNYVIENKYALRFPII